MCLQFDVCHLAFSHCQMNGRVVSGGGGGGGGGDGAGERLPSLLGSVISHFLPSSMRMAIKMCTC